MARTQSPPRDLDLHVAEQGDGERVIFLPAVGSNGAQWRGVVRRLAARVHALMPDLVGEGSGTWPRPDAGALLDEEEALLAALLDRVGRAHVVGHSYGGFLAMRLAARHPSRVRSLVLVEPIAFGLLEREGPAAERDEIRAVERACAEALAAGDAASAAASFVNYWSGAAVFAALPELSQRAVAAVMPKICRGWREVVAADEPQIPATIPATLVCGARSPSPTRWIARRLAAGARHLVELDGAGHMSPITHPDALARAVDAHLASVGVAVGGASEAAG